MRITTTIFAGILITAALMEVNAQEKTANKNFLPQDPLVFSTKISCEQLFNARWEWSTKQSNCEVVESKPFCKQDQQGNHQQLKKGTAKVRSQNDRITGDKLQSKTNHIDLSGIRRTGSSSLKRFLY